MAHTLEDLVQMQHAADQAHAHVLQLRDQYGRPTVIEWTDEQTLTYEKAWRDWRELSRTVQAAVTEYAKAEGKPRFEIEAAVKKTGRH
ncbi:hypothetical protein [Streptomyces bobili]|uniref:hypothetical protein n=1 Tax=Streptomyces bobili TaxID=67280 RepID=UPI000A399402|nr:hypothetical protein [Streptomyces bobili]